MTRNLYPKSTFIFLFGSERILENRILFGFIELDHTRDERAKRKIIKMSMIIFKMFWFFFDAFDVTFHVKYSNFLLSFGLVTISCRRLYQQCCNLVFFLTLSIYLPSPRQTLDLRRVKRNFFLIFSRSQMKMWTMFRRLT